MMSTYSFGNRDYTSSYYHFEDKAAARSSVVASPDHAELQGSIARKNPAAERLAGVASSPSSSAMPMVLAQQAPVSVDPVWSIGRRLSDALKETLGEMAPSASRNPAADWLAGVAAARSSSVVTPMEWAQEAPVPVDPVWSIGRRLSDVLKETLGEMAPSASSNPAADWLAGVASSPSSPAVTPMEWAQEALNADRVSGIGASNQSPASDKCGLQKVADWEEALEQAKIKIKPQERYSITSQILNSFSDKALDELNLAILNYLSSEDLSLLQPRVLNRAVNSTYQLISSKGPCSLVLDYAVLSDPKEIAWYITVSDMDGSVLNGLSAETLRGLDPGVLNFLPTCSVHKLDARVVNGLSPKAQNGLKPILLKRLLPKVILNLDAAVFHNLPRTVFNNLSDNIIKNIIHPDGFSEAREFNKITGIKSKLTKKKKKQQLLNAGAINKLPERTLFWLREWVLNGLSPEEFAKLDARTLNALHPVCIRNINIDLLKTLPRETVIQLTDMTLENLPGSVTDGAFSNLSRVSGHGEKMSEDIEEIPSLSSLMPPSKLQ